MDSKINSSDRIYSLIVESGYNKSKKNIKTLAVKGILGGMFVGIACNTTSVAIHGIDNAGLAKLIAGITFPVGLMLIVLTASELFTSTCFMFLNFADKKISVKAFFKVLLTVYLSNAIGTFIIAFLALYSGQLSMSNQGLAFFAMSLSSSKMSLSFFNAFISGIFCNILVCCAVLMANSAVDTTGKILGIFFSVMAFAISGVEHCVANMYFITIGIMASFHPTYANLIENLPDYQNLTFLNMITDNLIPVTLGNIFGGLLFSVLVFFSMRPKAID